MLVGFEPDPESSCLGKKGLLRHFARAALIIAANLNLRGERAEEIGEVTRLVPEVEAADPLRSLLDGPACIYWDSAVSLP